MIGRRCLARAALAFVAAAAVPAAASAQRATGSQAGLEILAPRYPGAVERDAVRLQSPPAPPWSRLDPVSLHEHAVFALVDPNCPAQLTVIAEETPVAIPRRLYGRPLAAVLADAARQLERGARGRLLATRKERLGATNASGAPVAGGPLPARVLLARGPANHVDSGLLISFADRRTSHHNLVGLQVSVNVYSINVDPGCERQVAQTATPTVLAMLRDPALIVGASSVP